MVASGEKPIPENARKCGEIQETIKIQRTINLKLPGATSIRGVSYPAISRLAKFVVEISAKLNLQSRHLAEICGELALCLGTIHMFCGDLRKMTDVLEDLRNPPKAQQNSQYLPRVTFRI